jgi:hypothetical protein
MPIYISIYLFLFFLFSFATTYMHFEEGKGVFFVIPEIVCYVFLISFILLFYFQEKFFLDKFFIIVMLFYTISWQVFSFIEDAKIAKTKFGIRDKELRFFVIVSVLFVLPCFIYAFLLLR